MTVLVGAMQADSRGSVVGRGSGDCSCFTVSSCTVNTRRVKHTEDEPLEYLSVQLQCMHAYLLALLQKEEQLHANRGDSSSLGSMEAAVGQEDPQQGLVLPQPGLATLRVLLLGLKAASLHLVSLQGAHV